MENRKKREQKNKWNIVGQLLTLIKLGLQETVTIQSYDTTKSSFHIAFIDNKVFLLDENNKMVGCWVLSNLLDLHR